MIRIQERRGQTKLITLTNQSDWMPADEIITAFSATPTKSGGGTTPTKKGRTTPTKFGTPPLPNLVPKGYPIKESQEGIPITNQEECGAVAPPFQGSDLEQGVLLRTVVEPEASDQPTTESATDVLVTTNEATRMGEHSARASKKSKPKKRKVSAEDIYKNLEHPDQFEEFWKWYSKKAKLLNFSAGDKSDAAQAWIDQIESNMDEYEQFRLGCKLFFQNPPQAGIPHACRFLAGGERKHRTPYWKTAIEEHQVSNSEGGSFVDDLPAESTDLKAQIGALLKQHNLSGILPETWQQKTGQMLVRDLDEQQKKEFLNYLKGLDHETRAYA
jgi:hypothetical protein